MAVIQALVSVIADQGDAIRSISVGCSELVVLIKGQLYLVAVSSRAEPPAALRRQLELLYQAIVMAVTAGARGARVASCDCSGTRLLRLLLLLASPAPLRSCMCTASCVRDHNTRAPHCTQASTACCSAHLATTCRACWPAPRAASPAWCVHTATTPAGCWAAWSLQQRRRQTARPRRRC